MNRQLSNMSMRNHENNMRRAAGLPTADIYTHYGIITDEGTKALIEAQEYTRAVLEYRKRKEEYEKKKKEVERLLNQALVTSMQQGSDIIADQATDQVVGMVNAAFGGTGGGGSKGGSRSFAVDLGALLGKALGEAPFKLLDEIFDDTDPSKK